MLPAVCRKLGYGWLLVQGLLATVAPRMSIKLNLKLAGMGFENVDELEPREWYVRSVRAVGVGMLAAGGVGLLLEGRTGSTDTDTPAAGGDADDGPVVVSTDEGEDGAGGDHDEDGETDE